MASEEQVYEDDLGIEIEVYIKEGECFQVNYKGVPTRARVIDYDVVFPCVASNLKQDSDGDMYMETVV